MMLVMVMAVMVVPAFWYLKQSNATATVFLVYILYKQFKTLYKGPFKKQSILTPVLGSQWRWFKMCLRQYLKNSFKKWKIILHNQPSQNWNHILPIKVRQQCSAVSLYGDFKVSLYLEPWRQKNTTHKPQLQNSLLLDISEAFRESCRFIDVNRFMKVLSSSI